MQILSYTTFKNGNLIKIMALIFSFFCSPAAAVCVGGYGNYVNAGTPTCSICTPDTYGPKGSTAACTPCPGGGVSARKSDGAGDCYTPWQQLLKDFDYLPVASAGMMTPVSGVNTAEDCELSCDDTASCTFYQFNSAEASTANCAHYIAPVAPVGGSTIEVGFKIDTGVYSVIPGNADSTNLGVDISSPMSDSIRNCLHECDKIEACVVVVVSEQSLGQYKCGMKQGGLSADIKTKYKVAGAKIGDWTLELA